VEVAVPAPAPIATQRDLLGWAGPLGAATVGAALRLWHLGQPHALVFDETYYAKDALSLISFGVERNVVDDANDILLALPPRATGADIFLDTPAFVVHPPLGKWLIGLGELAFGVNPFGWRIVAAVASILSILLLGRIVRRLTGNSLLGTIAAGLLALDGLHLVMGRTALLDGFLMLFVLAAFGALLIDRDHSRALRLRHGPAAASARVRWWRLAAGALLGAACSVKWSGVWYLLAFVGLSVAWDAASRRSAGDPRPWRSALGRDLLPAAATMVAAGALVYLVSWTGWLLSDDGWARQWDEGMPGFLPQPLRALMHYHASMYRFHVGLTQNHPYQAPGWGWLLQARPTSFYYNGDGTACGADQCSQAVTSLGNPVIWWAAVGALVHQTYRAVFVRDWRSAAVVVGVLAGWVPWLFYPDRTIFGFYAVVLLPFLVAALTLSLGQVLAAGPVAQRRWRVWAVGGYLLLVVAAAWWFLPVWTAQEITRTEWSMRMWLAASWI
jgi:dolichyl-phosphate-mannose--protein O-mannosyl transferase